MHSPTTRCPPLHQLQSPPPHRKSTRQDGQQNSCRWPSLALASASTQRQSPERLADSRRGPPPDQGARAADGEEEGLTETVLLGLGVGGAGLCADLDPDPLETTETETSPSAYSAFWGQR